jgi:hypothetical protein
MRKREEIRRKYLEGSSQLAGDALSFSRFDSQTVTLGWRKQMMIVE